MSIGVIKNCRVTYALTLVITVAAFECGKSDVSTERDHHFP